MSLTFALVGNQNCGKSTLFNYLTGSNQHVGNFPGVTVQKRRPAADKQRRHRYRSARHLFVIALYIGRNRDPRPAFAQ